MRRFHHGHALGVGVVGGLLIASHIWLVLTLGLVLGWIARDLYSAVRWTVMALAAVWARKHPERLMARRLLRGKVPY